MSLKKKRVAPCSNIYIKHRNALCERNVEIFKWVWCLVCRVEWKLHTTLHTKQSSTQNNKYRVPHKHSFFSWWWGHSRLKHVEIDNYSKNKYAKDKLCTELVLFSRLYMDTRSTEHKNNRNIFNKTNKCEGKNYLLLGCDNRYRYRLNCFIRHRYKSTLVMEAVGYSEVSRTAK